eukprot:gb/GECH01011437.1/.p1 GENE.gb/GECH01011437.1/~~gb/GECH01011437.1/.p1  ORF type:complete len:565 (+),score=157.37 gb/GECH01011437.1/:1-1695(+)
MNTGNLDSFQESISKHLSSSPVDEANDITDYHKQLDTDIDHVDLEDQGIQISNIVRNPSVPYLYESALSKEVGSAMTSTGALVARSGTKTGRSPKDKRIVDEPTTSKDVWWGPVNIKMDDHTFMINRERAIDYLNTREKLFVFDGYAGWDPEYRINVRVVCARAYHALFMNNMLIRPSREELADFEPDYIIYNAGQFPANRFTSGMTSSTSVSINFGRQEMCILGSQYAGEMKKGVLTIMMYLMPKLGVLPLHSSANEGKDGDVTLFFGLSGTGKTTLSADPHRDLIGDDEHVWTDKGVFNIEGGCYAKCIGLSPETEPDIFNAIRFGAVQENVVYDPSTRVVDYDDTSITENTRCAYPLEHIPNSKIPAVGGHPNNVVLLTCDAFGVLPPVSKLTPEQVEYHFISGYTAKVAGTEVGVTEPTATFSACFGEPFLVWHPTKYASMLAEKLQQHKASAWLVNTGWTGGSFGVGHRFKLKHTRAIIDAINNGSLENVETEEMPIFGLRVPKECPGVPDEVLMPKRTWKDKSAFDETASKLAKLFVDNFKNYKDVASEAVINAGPHV